jgi:hypothetical protein
MSATAPGAMTPSRVRFLLIPTAASAVHMLMLVPGYTSESGIFDLDMWLVALVLSLVSGIAIFAFVVPGAGTRTAAVLAATALASVAVFWFGLTLPLATAAGFAGWRARERGDRRRLGAAALVVVGFTVIALIVVLIEDARVN